MLKCNKIGIDCEWCDYKNECFSNIKNNSLDIRLKEKIHKAWENNNENEAFLEKLKISYKIKYNKLLDELYNIIKDYDYQTLTALPKQIIYYRLSEQKYEEYLKNEDNYGFFISYIIERLPDNFNKKLEFNVIKQIQKDLECKLNINNIEIFLSNVAFSLDPNKLNILIFIQP